MDLDEFLERPSLSQYPLSLILRMDATTDPASALNTAILLLRDRHPLDEILLPTGYAWPRVGLPPNASPRIKLVPESIGSSRSLELAFRLCRWPIIVMSSPSIRLTREKLDEMLQYLEQCDLVAGHRKGATTWWTWLAERPFRWFFGVPVRDPFCPVKAIRGPAVTNIILKQENIVDFELIAKLTYLTSLMDECEVDSFAPPRKLLATLLGNLPSLARLAIGPKFWDAGSRADRLRPALNRDDSLPTPPSRICVDRPPEGHWTRRYHLPWGRPTLNPLQPIRPLEAKSAHGR